MTEDDRPFFIVSAPRLDCALTRLIRDAHPRWLFDPVCPYLRSYGMNMN